MVQVSWRDGMGLALSRHSPERLQREAHHANLSPSLPTVRSWRPVPYTAPSTCGKTVLPKHRLWLAPPRSALPKLAFLSLAPAS